MATSCSTCSGGCIDGCKGGCDDGCTNCGVTCGGGCSGDCDDSCDGTCQGTCSTGCQDTCAGKCSGTCQTHCNTACSAENAAAVIANLGNSIVSGSVCLASDIVAVKNAIANEFTRRGAYGFTTAYRVKPVSGGAILMEHGSLILSDVYKFSTTFTEDGTKDWRGLITDDGVLKASDLRPAIEYIKVLMNRVVRPPLG